MNFENFKKFEQWERASRDTIDFKKVYVDIAGDVIAGLLLSQLVYWSLPTKKGDAKLRVRRGGKSWLAKARHEWWQEARLSPKQVDRARQKLEHRELIETTHFRFNGLKTMHWRIVEDKFLAKLREAVNSPPENPWEPVLPEGQYRTSRKGNTGVAERVTPITESTAENTDKEKERKGVSEDGSAGGEDFPAEWIEVGGKSCTWQNYELAVEEFGKDLTDLAIEKTNSWQDAAAGALHFLRQDVDLAI